MRTVWFSWATMCTLRHAGAWRSSPINTASAMEALARALAGADMTAVGLAAGLALLAVDLILLAIGIARFQRTRLILG